MKRLCAILIFLHAHAPVGSCAAEAAAAEWAAAARFRVSLKVDARGRKRSNSPAALAMNFQQALQTLGVAENFDEHTIEVRTSIGDAASQRVAHRVENLFGAPEANLHFVVPSEKHTNFAVYFDTGPARRGKPKRYHGLIGDGDRFVEEYGRRESAANHFDCFVDFDGDGDLDLFKGGVEPFVYCYENVGRNRLVDRGRLASGGKVFKLPCSRSNRSWVTVAFFDIDADGDQDFFPSFGDGPDAGKIILYRNDSEHRGELRFTRVGPLQTEKGTALAGGAQAGGWFPSITFIRDFDGDGLGPDAIVGSNHRGWLYRGLGTSDDGSPRFAEAVAVRAGEKEIVLVNPRFDCADIDADGDLDLFAGTQPGAVYWFRNVGTPARSEFAEGMVVAWSGKYLIGDAHSGVKVADFDGDGLLDIASGRFWERADLNAPNARRDYGGFFRNTGTRTVPRFERRLNGGPFTEQFQICDAVRQNCVRAVDWDNDGKRDLVAGDTDGFIWWFRNRTGGPLMPEFERGERLRAIDKPLNVTATGGHARFDVADWNNDGRRDLVVADGNGTVTLFLNRGRKSRPVLAAGEALAADGKPIQIGGRSSVLICDWNSDGRKDLLLADSEGYYLSRNRGTDSRPSMSAPEPVHFGGKRVSYVRPNLGAFIDWDGDGMRDFIGCHFENSIRFYPNLGPMGELPRFNDPEGIILLHGESPQMISGADVLDWNEDGDLDLLSGQGHGGSGLRFYERDWIEDELHGTHPEVKVGSVERRVGKLRPW